MLSAICFNLDQSKTLLSGNGLNYALLYDVNAQVNAQVSLYIDKMQTKMQTYESCSLERGFNASAKNYQQRPACADGVD